MSETLSDFDDGIISEGTGRMLMHGFDDVVSGSDSGGEREVDSEATVTDPDPWESDQDIDSSIPWQPAQRLTARQLARQERLLQGIQQTQWSDMHLPRGLDLRNKARQKEVVSEEQHLRRVKAAEVRRAQTQKAKRDTMEITKARIRAATSNKFRDMVGHTQTEKREGRKRTRLVRGRIRYRYRKGSTVMMLPKGMDIPNVLTARSAAGYPPTKMREAFQLSEDFSKDALKLGLLIVVERTNAHLLAYDKGQCLGQLIPMERTEDKTIEGTSEYPMQATVTSIRHVDASSANPHSIVLATKQSPSLRPFHTVN